MSFNYGGLGNQALQNILPLFGNMANSTAANQPNFMSQLVAAMSTVGGNPSGASLNSQAQTSAPSTSSASTVYPYSRNRRASTPEAPPAPRLSENPDDHKAKMKPNQGALPMDLDYDAEPEAAAITNVDAQSSSSSKAGQQMLKVSDSMLLNGLMSGGMNAAASYMFFPTTSGSMLMDHTSMMAAAMQQMQGYGGYMPGPTDSTPTVEGATEQAVNYPQSMKEVVKTKNCILFPPNPNAPPPTIRERPPGCRTVFVGGLPENATEDIIREIFESCGEITTLRMSKKNFCHIRYRHEASIDRAIYLSGYRVRISTMNDPSNFGRLHVDYAQARDDQYDYECKQRQLQREQRHRDRVALDRIRSQSPPPIPHYTDHEASLVSENLRSNESFLKAVQTISVWLERGDCTKRNANMFYSMIQSTHAHVRRLHTDKQQLEEDLKKARESYRKQMLVMSKQFTQIEKVFNAASHKKVWDHFSKAQRKNIDQWKKLATELRSVQIEDDEMEMSDEDREHHGSSAKRSRYDSEHLKDENDSLRCQLEAMRNEISLERTDSKYDNDFREKQMKVLQETIRNLQTQLLQIKTKEQKDSKTIEHLERKLKESGVKQLLLKTKIRETTEKLKERENSSRNSEASDQLLVEESELEEGDADAQTKQASNSRQETEKKDVATAGDTQPAKHEAPQEQGQETVIDVDEIHNDALPNEVVEIKDDEPASEQNKIESEPISDKNLTSALTGSDETNDLDKEDDEKPHLDLTEARVIVLVAAYLVVHPLGVSSAHICDYLRSIIKPCELETDGLTLILKKYTNLFESTAPSEQTNESRTEWKFCGFAASAPSSKEQ